MLKDLLMKAKKRNLHIPKMKLTSNKHLIRTSQPATFYLMVFLKMTDWVVTGIYFSQADPLQKQKLSSDFPDSTAYQQIVTYWPLQSKPNSTSELESCNWLVDNYDYPKAEIILSYIRMNHVNGPILVAWQTPFNPGSMGRDYLVFNLSNFANNDIHRAISVWKGQTIKGPEDWEEGFLYARTKEELRNFIQQYGNSIFSIVTGGG